MSRPYLRPAGLVAGTLARDLIESGLALPLAGGPIAFTAAALIERGSGTDLRGAADLAASEERALVAALDRITRARPPVGGLAMDRPRLMGIVNVTPDSFSDGGLYDTTEAAVAHAAGLVQMGAEILDIGGESTRPGAEPLSCQSEIERVLPVIEALRGIPAKLSVDTRKADVMRSAAGAGAQIINDISALSHEPGNLAAAAESGLAVMLMHAQGDPRTMQDNPVYDDVLLDVFDYLEQRIQAAEAAGIDRGRIVADPGIGFGKTFEHNLALLEGFSLFHGLGVALMVGASRKRFIGVLSGEDDPRRRDPGSHAAALAAAAQGAQILRVHDVAGTRQAVAVWSAIAEARRPAR